MSVSCCFWALLSLEKFKFIYLPDFITDTQIGLGKTAGDILLSQSLLQFIHPDERSMAQTDLYNFVKIKTLAGAVTRYTLPYVSFFLYLILYADAVDWDITDVVMYTATNNTILTFFHCPNTGKKKKSSPFKLEKSLGLPEGIDFFRIFQLYDTETGQGIMSWPLSKEMQEVNELATVLSKQEMEKRVDDANKTGCTQHSHLSSTHHIPTYGICQFERIIIRYERLTFSSFQITPIKHTVAPGQATQVEPKAWRGRFGAYEKKCENCQTNKSPEWRRGPSGHKT
ncbi:uncharacterized protein EV154DRAFT_420702 [Mucor mucedo]|uniref:uncharacterized protein n=1 Tax=Mucor mucedo TaxID=29922 RepID=UPI00222029D5|nr:uncharacterized protein EV154DRAFT_420702 [Mucor mucedo]KAI7891222.1 hypothetical protein EV154DRAFT_420702 [Mucor mucedo]